MPVLSARLPVEIVFQIMDFAYGVPADNKKRLLADAHSIYMKQQDYYKKNNCYYYENDEPDEMSMSPWLWSGTLKKNDDPGQYEKIQYHPNHYRRTDEESSGGYEDYYLEEKVPQDYPRNQLHLYKRYARQLEQQIQLLKKQLQSKMI